MKTDTQNTSGRTTYRPTAFLLSLLLACGTALGQYEPPDLYGDANKGSSVLRRNNGQVFDTGHNLRPDVKYSFEGSPVGIALRDSSRISFSFATMHHDSMTPDTAYRVDMSIRGAKAVSPTALHSAAGVANYYRGSHSTELVPAFYRGVYQNIITNTDLHVYGSSSGPRMAFVMRPGSNPSALMLHFNGQDSIGIDWQGALKVYLSGRWVKLEQAAAYQVAANGSLVSVNWTASYTHSNGAVDVGFSFGTYNSTLPLVLQIGYGPMALGGGEPDTRNLGWSTYMGGNGGDALTSVETDGDGNPYLCGHTWAADFPVAPGNQQFTPFIGYASGYDDAVIMKFQASNKQLVWATYYAGSTAATNGNFAKTEAQKVAVYTGGDNTLQYVFAIGTTNCSDFAPWRQTGTPFASAVHEAYSGGQHRMWVGAFRKSDGRRDWATTHGENNTHTWEEQGLSITVDPTGTLAVGGRLYGYNAVTPTFPLVTPSGAYQQSVGGGFVMIYNPNYTIRWSTTYGGLFTAPYTQVTDLRFTHISANGHIKLWLTGATAGNPFNNIIAPSGAYNGNGMAFLASFDVTSLQQDFSTRWGGSFPVSIAYGLDIAGKNIWVVGGTEAQDLTDTECPAPPGTAGVYHTHVNSGSLPHRQCDGFILAFDVLNHNIKYGTLIGGSYYDMLLDVNHDLNNVYITGETRSPSGFGADLGPNRYYQAQNPNASTRDAVILAIKNDDVTPTLLWRTPFGGVLSDRGWGIAASNTEVYLTGATASAMWDDFPLKEFDPVGPLDFYQDYNMGGSEYSFLDWYSFELGLDFENNGYGEAPPELLDQPHDGFIASFNSIFNSVGIDEISEHAPILSVIPLPTLGQWVVHFPNTGDWTVSAFDPTGREVGSWRSSGTTLEVDLSAQDPGMYLLRATTTAGELRSAKIVRP